MTPRNTFFAVLTASLMGAPGLRAQQRGVPLDTLRVSAASRAAAEVATGTRAVEVIDAGDIRRSPARTVADLVQWAFGVDGMPRSGAAADVAVRGSSFEQVLVLVDGIRASDAQTGHFDLDLAVPLDQIDRIEIVRGPGSALHGADAMAGVIQIVTRRGRGSAARLEAGSFGTTNLSLSHTGNARGVHADIAADLQRSDGHRAGTDYESGIVRAALSAPTGGGTLAGDAAFAARNFGADRFYGPFPSYEKTRTATASLAWRAVPTTRLAIEPALSLRRHDDHFILRRENPAAYENEHWTLQAGGELIARYALTPLVRVAGGVEAYRDLLRSPRLGDRAESRGALLAELVAGRVGAATGTAGLRIDRHEAFGAFWSPSLAAAWWPLRPLRVRGSVGRAFRTPTWTERYYKDPANIGDPGLAPERAWSGEVGLDAYPASGVRIGAAGFLRAAEDLIDWAKPVGEPTSPWRTRNVEDATYQGLEAELRVDDLLGTRWVARGSWLSLDSSEAPGFKSKYALRPLVDVVSLAADRVVLRGLTVGGRAQRARRVGEKPYTRLDARAGYQLPVGRVYVDLQNATAAQYLDIIGVNAAGRSLLVGVEWTGRR
ncbi:MAG: TonB-dependent receptor [Gemmatimonadetes bacterium]|nr:TonB-dependent receptor [Gemmatimonadota bacterium]